MNPPSSHTDRSRFENQSETYEVSGWWFVGFLGFLVAIATVTAASAMGEQPLRTVTLAGLAGLFVVCGGFMAAIVANSAGRFRGWELARTESESAPRIQEQDQFPRVVHGDQAPAERPARKLHQPHHPLRKVA